jgi:hypothetical protein
LASEEDAFLEKLGYTNSYSHSLTRSTTGDRLFVQFKDKNGTSRVVEVSPEAVRVRELPGASCLNNAGDPILWRNEQAKAYQTAPSSILPTNVYAASLICSAPFLALFDSKHSWVARYESPLTELTLIPRDENLQLLSFSGDALHMFTRGPPHGKPRKDGWFILKHYTYELSGSGLRLLNTQDFYFTWQVFDFDAQTGLMVARSWNDMFARALLVDTNSGDQKSLGFVGAHGLFLKQAVLRKFREIATGPVQRHS